MALSMDHGPGWLVQHQPVAAREWGILAGYEARALSIEGYQGAVLPELLQTPAYASAVLVASPNVAGGEVRERVGAVAERRRVLDRDDAPICTFFVHELVLHTPVGGAAVMSEQLHALLRSSVRPNVTVRVVPRTAGAHAGMSGPFSLVDVRDFKQIVYLDGETASQFLETPTEVGAYRGVLRALARVALDDVRSRELIATLATKLYGVLDTLRR